MAVVSIKQTGDLQSLLKNVAELDKKLRRQKLRKIGTEVSKIQLAAMKRIWKSEGRDVTGALGKSFGRKVSLNRDFTKVTAMAGPRRGTKTKGVLRRRTYAVTRKTKAGNVPVLNKKGKQLVRVPTRYAHLAGKGRKSRFAQRTQAQTKTAVRDTMVKMMTEAVANKGA